MIHDPHVLTAQTPPTDLAYRDGELDALEYAFESLTRGASADGAFVFGPTGVGKTVTARHLLDRLGTKIDCPTVYIDGFDCRTRASVLRAIVGSVEALGCPSSAPTDELLRRVRDRDAPLVVVLDEADTLDGDVIRDVLDERPIAPLVIATGERAFKSRLSDRVGSRLTRLQPVEFDPYSDASLVGIMRDRVRAGVCPEALSDSQLWRIADAAAGDARLALSILSHALGAAERAERGAVRGRDIESAIPDAEASITADVVDSVTDDQRAVLRALVGCDPATSGVIYDRYATQADDPVTSRTVREYLPKLVQYGVVERRGPDHAPEYALVDGVAEVLDSK